MRLIQASLRRWSTWTRSSPSWITNCLPKDSRRTTSMSSGPIPEMVNGLPNLCGCEAQVEEATRSRAPVYLPETNLRLDQLRAVFAIALHMQQPLIPAGGPDMRTAATISNLAHMVRNLGTGVNHNASV